jgi:ATP-dependent Clp protease ATP-binding subunit ClpC
MEAKFSNRVKEVISLSREEALRLGHDYIGTEHLLLGMIREGEGVAVSILKKLGVSLDDLRTAIEQATRGTASVQSIFFFLFCGMKIILLLKLWLSLILLMML